MPGISKANLSDMSSCVSSTDDFRPTSYSLCAQSLTGFLILDIADDHGAPTCLAIIARQEVVDQHESLTSADELKLNPVEH